MYCAANDERAVTSLLHEIRHFLNVLFSTPETVSLSLETLEQASLSESPSHRNWSCVIFPPDSLAKKARNSS